MAESEKNHVSFQCRKTGMGHAVVLFVLAVVACIFWPILLLFELIGLLGGRDNIVRFVSADLRENMQDFILYVFTFGFLRY